MDCCDRIQLTVDYIEEHLKDEIDMNDVIVESYYSVTHFYRLFGAMVGVSPKDYIRKRRLTCAVIELCTDQKRLIDLAFDYGFQSQEAFTRAFLREFGITPGRFRLKTCKTKLYEKINVRHRLQFMTGQESFIRPRIILDREFQVIGLSREVKPASDMIKSLWQEFLARQHEINTSLSQDKIGLCEYAPDITDEGNFTYMACIEVGDITAVPEGMTARRIPCTKYVKITHEDSMESLKATYHAFYGNWFPNSGLELAEKDTIEVYPLDRGGLDIYIPIK